MCTVYHRSSGTVCQASGCVCWPLQMACALYFIDKLALRAGHEKDEDEADTVGCCTLKVRNSKGLGWGGVGWGEHEPCHDQTRSGGHGVCAIEVLRCCLVRAV